MKKHLLLLTITFSLTFISARAQDDLMELFGNDKKEVEYAYATFKTTRVINSQSIENPAKGVLLFLIQHRFGRLNTGSYEFFGLDQSTIRLGLEYGVTNRLAVGLGRSSYQKTFDGFIKYKILRQSKGPRRMPVTLSYVVSSSLTSLKWSEMGVGDRTNYFSSRITYVHQLLLARKFSNTLSFQLMPTLVHKNLVTALSDNNDIYSVGIGGRVKLTKRMTINAEYFYTPGYQISYEFTQPLSVGIEIETGGHVFQLHFSNAQAFFDRGFITETNGKWTKGDIYFGFGISRVFTIVKPDDMKK
jgi:hypothetical protein